MGELWDVTITSTKLWDKFGKNHGIIRGCQRVTNQIGIVRTTSSKAGGFTNRKGGQSYNSALSFREMISNPNFNSETFKICLSLISNWPRTQVNATPVAGQPDLRSALGPLCLRPDIFSSKDTARGPSWWYMARVDQIWVGLN